MAMMCPKPNPFPVLTIKLTTAGLNFSSLFDKRQYQMQSINDCVVFSTKQDVGYICYSHSAIGSESIVEEGVELLRGELLLINIFSTRQGH